MTKPCGFTHSRAMLSSVFNATPLFGETHTFYCCPKSMTIAKAAFTSHTIKRHCRFLSQVSIGIIPRSVKDNPRQDAGQDTYFGMFGDLGGCVSLGRGAGGQETQNGVSNLFKVINQSMLRLLQCLNACKIRFTVDVPSRNKPNSSAANMTQPLKCSSRKVLVLFSQGRNPRFGRAGFGTSCCCSCLW